MEKEKTIGVLNSLSSIEINEFDSESLYEQFISASQRSKQLEVEVNSLDSEIPEGTKVSGKFFRVWMDVKAALTSKDRKAILNSCEYGEDGALDWMVGYFKALQKVQWAGDPREGRGLFNTYNVSVPLLRYPLDNIFYSKEFGLLTLEKLEDIGSDSTRYAYVDPQKTEGLSVLKSLYSKN